VLVVHEGDLTAVQEVQQAVLPVLVRLLGECSGEREDVPSVLCQLVSESEELQQVCGEQ